MEIHKICRKKRREKEMSQAQLAEYCGLTQGTIAAFERTGGGLSVKNLSKILETLGIEIQE